MENQDFSPLARLVHDTLYLATHDEEMVSDLTMEDVMDIWLLWGVKSALEDRGVGTSCFNVRVCNYPLEQYLANLNLPDVSYRVFSYLEVDGVFFHIDYRLENGRQTMGPVSYTDEQSVIEASLARKKQDKPGVSWHHDTLRNNAMVYVNEPTKARITGFMTQPLVVYEADTLGRETPGVPTYQRLPRL